LEPLVQQVLQVLLGQLDPQELLAQLELLVQLELQVQQVLLEQLGQLDPQELLVQLELQDQQELQELLGRQALPRCKLDRYLKLMTTD
jgi:hypothetical protein